MVDELKTAIKAGEIMLRNGSETFRVQSVIEMFLKDGNIEYKDIIVIGTAIIVTLQPYEGPPLTMSRSIDRRKNNLRKLSLVTRVGEDYGEGRIPIEEAGRRLEAIDHQFVYKPWVKVLATCLSTAFFTIGYGSELGAALAIFLITLIPAYFIQLSLRKNIAFFLSNILSGALVSLFSLIVLSFYPLLQFDKMIASVIIVFTPGILAVTAIRDVVNGDFITGASRAIEALTLAAGLGIGVGFVFSVYVFISGGVVWTF